MDKEKILRLCNEIKDIATEIQERTMKDSYIMAQTIINKILVIATEISAKSKSNGDRIRQMTDEELAEWLTDGHDKCDICKLCSFGACRIESECKKGVLEWLKQEVEKNDN